MKQAHTGAVKAVLGPTNTGKTHLAVERLCAHSSGMMGFPLRLLAREVYDRVVAIKGAAEVGLITGEEKIMPPGARWLLCTVESMPVSRELSFVALDEAQLGIDRARGHVFTDRLLNVRGRDETMILGSDSLRPMIRALVPEAEIIARPRFSQLSYAPPLKLSRLPPRSAIVAFSAEQVYAVAEMLRRTRGGAAVVMGSLSPRTRNAQVAMFQAGEVDYLVATDAIGMGLNMDVSHIAFASLSKFDGQRQRRLTIAEMAQIAGRAGRHQRDGSFGVLAGMGGEGFTDSEVERIEAHRFPPLDHLLWRNAAPDFSSLDALSASLEELPEAQMLRLAPEAIDMAVLRLMSAQPDIRDRVRRPAEVALLWEMCGLPDFRKVGAEHHVSLVRELFGQRLRGQIETDWFARELARLDNVGGDVDRIAMRIAGVRTLAYIAQRPAWLAQPGEWAVRTMVLEERLSDALHQRLTERFVDRRTAVLMRAVGRDPGLLDVAVSDGVVSVEEQPIGTLSGFRFSIAADARRGDRKMLLAAAELHLPRELARRAATLAQAGDGEFSLAIAAAAPVALHWRGAEVARLAAGRDLLHPQLMLDRGLSSLTSAARDAVRARLDRWVTARLAQRLAALVKIDALANSARVSADLRAVLAPLMHDGGPVARAEVDAALARLDGAARHQLRQLGLVIGSLDLFHPAMLKPEAAALRLALVAAQRGLDMPPLPMPGLGLLDRPAPALAASARVAGYRDFGDQLLRVDLVERIARAAHDARGATPDFVPDPGLAVAMGIGQPTLARILRALGFSPAGDPAAPHWRWQGRPRTRPAKRPDNPAFAALAGWARR